VDRVPDRPVAGGLRQLPDVGSGHSVAARWDPFGLGPDQPRPWQGSRSRSHRDLRPSGGPHRIRTVSKGSTGHGGIHGGMRWPASSEVEDARARCLRLGAGRTAGIAELIGSAVEEAPPVPRWRWSCCRLTCQGGCMPNRRNELQTNRTQGERCGRSDRHAAGAD
jgi:hypothetical protein